MADTEHEVIECLHRIETLLDNIAAAVERLEDVDAQLDSIRDITEQNAEHNAEIAWMSHPWYVRAWYRHRAAWAMAKGQADMERLLDRTMKANRDGHDE